MWSSCCSRGTKFKFENSEKSNEQNDRLKLHSKRVEKMRNYTRNEWRRCEITLETSGEDAKLHSKRVEKMQNYTRNGWRRCKITLETSGEDTRLHFSNSCICLAGSKKVTPLFLITPASTIPYLWKLTTKSWKLTVVLEYYEAMETYSRIGRLRSYGNLQSYWTTTKLWKLTVVLDYYEAMETYSGIGILRSYGNLQSYWTSTSLVFSSPLQFF